MINVFKKNTRKMTCSMVDKVKAMLCMLMCVVYMMNAVCTNTIKTFDEAVAHIASTVKAEGGTGKATLSEKMLDFVVELMNDEKNIKTVTSHNLNSGHFFVSGMTRKPDLHGFFVPLSREEAGLEAEFASLVAECRTKRKDLLDKELKETEKELIKLDKKIAEVTKLLQLHKEFDELGKKLSELVSELDEELSELNEGLSELDEDDDEKRTDLVEKIERLTKERNKATKLHKRMAKEEEWRKLAEKKEELLAKNLANAPAKLAERNGELAEPVPAKKLDIWNEMKKELADELDLLAKRKEELDKELTKQNKERAELNEELHKRLTKNEEELADELNLLAKRKEELDKELVVQKNLAKDLANVAELVKNLPKPDPVQASESRDKRKKELDNATKLDNRLTVREKRVELATMKHRQNRLEEDSTKLDRIKKVTELALKQKQVNNLKQTSIVHCFEKSIKTSMTNFLKLNNLKMSIQEREGEEQKILIEKCLNIKDFLENVQCLEERYIQDLINKEHTNVYKDNTTFSLALIIKRDERGQPCFCHFYKEK